MMSSMLDCRGFRRRLAEVLLVIALSIIWPIGAEAAKPATGNDYAQRAIELEEVVVRPRHERYSKRNNPAVDLATALRRMADNSDPRRNPHYNYRKYERITVGLNDIAAQSSGNLLLNRYDFLRDNVDTMDVTGKPVLPLSIREKLSDVHYRREPRSEKEMIHALRQEGLDDFMDQGNMRALFDDFFKDVDLYANDIDLLHNRLVSPLSRIAPDFYKFYITDTVMIDTMRCTELSFVPRNSQMPGFAGKLYIGGSGDSTMFIRRVVMDVPKAINLNFIEGLHVRQDFERGPDGSRLPVSDDLIAEIAIAPGTKGIYIRRTTDYSFHDFMPCVEPEVFNNLGNTLYGELAVGRDSAYWTAVRPRPLTRGEANISGLTTGLRSDKLYRMGEGLLKILVLGYVKTGNGRPSKVDLGPVNTLVSHNSLEGYRFRLGGMTTANLSKRLFARGYAAYGIRDRKLKYAAEIEYSFADKKYHSREFPVHSLRASYKYDVNMIGQKFLYTNPDNLFLSIRRHKDNQINYLREASLTYTLELRNNFSLTASVKHSRQEAAALRQFVRPDGRSFAHYDESSLNIQLRYAPGERIYQTASNRIRINEDVPTFTLSHTYAPKGVFGNMFQINRTEFSVAKRIWFSAFGYVDGIIKAGHLWSAAPYPELLIPNANLSYTIQPESFALMNPMEFVTDSYASWDLTYWANGAIFNYIPVVKRLKLREVFSFRGVWGHLSTKNNPASNPELFMFPEISHTQHMTNTPYMEVGVGIDNIFRILRLDYVWRLTYRSVPGVDKGGLRLALHFSF